MRKSIWTKDLGEWPSWLAPLGRKFLSGVCILLLFANVALAASDVWFLRNGTLSSTSNQLLPPILNLLLLSVMAFFGTYLAIRLWRGDVRGFIVTLAIQPGIYFREPMRNDIPDALPVWWMQFGFAALCGLVVITSSIFLFKSDRSSQSNVVDK